MDKIIIYQTADGQTSIDVKLEQDTVWLSQAQMAELFQKDRTVIGRHINNIFKEGELSREQVCAKFAHTTRHGAMEGRLQERELVLYNLDVIISVGYRVKSQRGTQFRIWANKILKDYLVKGYAINKSLAEQHYAELKQLVGVLGRTIKTQDALNSDETASLVEVVSDYAYALDPWINMITSSCLWSKQLTRRNFTLPTKGLFKQLIVYDRSSAPANSSETRRTILSKVLLVRYTKPSEGKTFILLLKKRRPCCFIW